MHFRSLFFFVCTFVCMMVMQGEAAPAIFHGGRGYRVASVPRTVTIRLPAPRIQPRVRFQAVPAPRVAYGPVVHAFGPSSIEQSSAEHFYW